MANRRAERGSAALAVIGALAFSTAVGVGVYFVIKGQRTATAQTAVAAPPALPVEPDPPPPREPIESPAPIDPPEPEVPVDRAAAEAVDPDVTNVVPSRAPIFGTPGIEGQLERAGIETAVQTAVPRLTRCFEKRIAAGAKIGGTLRVTMLVNRRGGVDTATGTGVDDELASCAAVALGGVRFSRTKDGGTAKVVYPIAFHDVQASDCDEVSCVLDDYARPCCQQFRRGASPPPADHVPGQPSRGDLLQALAALKPKVIACVSAEGMSGTYKVKFHVEPDGSVNTVTVSDGEEEVGPCIRRAFKAYTFPVSREGVTASFPFRVP